MIVYIGNEIIIMLWLCNNNYVIFYEFLVMMSDIAFSIWTDSGVAYAEKATDWIYLIQLCIFICNKRDCILKQYSLL